MTAPATVPTPVTQTPHNTTIRGGAWITWESGKSDVIRGMSVAVIRRRTPTALLSPKLTEAIAKATSIIEKEKAGRDRYINGAHVVDNIPTDREKAAEAALGIIRQALDTATTTGGLDVRDLIALYRRTTQAGDPLFKWEECVAVVAGGKSNIDGKYEIQDVPVGDFYLIASSSAGSGALHWFVPISCTGADLPLDLSTDNAEKPARLP
jgi:type II secretory pathway pseudopilin PulG